MDFVHGTTIAKRKTAPKTLYHKSDITAVAVAYKQLVDIKMPAGTAPGPVGGGRIGHDFFVESMSTLTYPTVGHLEAQINEILHHLCDVRVDFKTETADGLVLCPSDLRDSNYIMIDDEGGLWAIDFGRTCFLPPSFVSYSLITSSDIFVKYVAWYVDYPRSPNLRGMEMASGQMVIFGDNNLGQ
ncbi:hypothetical protein BV25DRAFT_763941 [Artomyces pyxidatus]|uniref:Uncharacterized protein n=1 Tax=Artomyces pyxidatus TaxID=48021 RepID=A0ACB8T0D2_9AGAM|nr:hypothetical protein BV25DRAFT_763941 [Artomyces pyxidatus]